MNTWTTDASLGQNRRYEVTAQRPNLILPRKNIHNLIRYSLRYLSWKYLSLHFCTSFFLGAPPARSLPDIKRGRVGDSFCSNIPRTCYCTDHICLVRTHTHTHTLELQAVVCSTQCAVIDSHTPVHNIQCAKRPRNRRENVIEIM